MVDNTQVVIALVGLIIVVLGNVVVVAYKYGQLNASVAFIQGQLTSHAAEARETWNEFRESREKRDLQMTEVLARLASLETAQRIQQAGGDNGAD